MIGTAKWPLSGKEHLDFIYFFFKKINVFKENEKIKATLEFTKTYQKANLIYLDYIHLIYLGYMHSC